MTESLLFLPWARRGIVQELRVEDRGGELPADAVVTTWVDIEGKRVTQDAHLRGPGSVIGLNPAQIVRTYPKPGTVDAETTFFPAIELATPTLPWMFTPAIPSSEAGRTLRPWLVLVVVELRAGIELRQFVERPLPAIVFGAGSRPEDELPDLEESAQWCHVQSTTPFADVSEAVASKDPTVVVRLLCPRRLRAHTTYLAALVPSFEPGRLAGLGQSAAGVAAMPAWTGAYPEGFELPAYYTWTFSTGDKGDFQALVKRLRPDDRPVGMGRYPLDVSNPGGGLTAWQGKRAVLVDYVGALQSIGGPRRAWNETHRSTFQAELRVLLDKRVSRVEVDPPPEKGYDPLLHDPVVVPPLYGSWPSDIDALPIQGWLAEANLNPDRRAAAGLGARIVRAHQEELMSAAWDQAGSLRQAMEELNHTRLSQEIARSWAHRVADVEEHGRVQLTARLHTFMKSESGEPISKVVQDSELPGGLISPAFQRAGRSQTPLARAWASKQMSGAGPNLVREVTRGFVSATTPASVVSVDVLSYSKVKLKTPRSRKSARAASAVDLGSIAVSIRNALDPSESLRKGLSLRIPGLEPWLTNAIPTTIGLGPRFTEPLYLDLQKLSSEFVLPGISEFENNRVRLLTINPWFAGAFLIGANHEMANELLWREYPADLRATCFDRFWDGPKEPDPDILPLSTWKRLQSIEQNTSDTSVGADAVVFVVRGDVVKRYPTASYYLVPQGANGEPDPTRTVNPSFWGALGGDAVFFGFSTTVPEALGRDGGNGYFVAIEEQATEPRFGVNEPSRTDKALEDLSSWDELSWGNLGIKQGAYLRSSAVAELKDTNLGGAIWNRNAAHMARITYQKPFRMYIHASHLLAG